MLCFARQGERGSQNCQAAEGIGKNEVLPSFVFAWIYMQMQGNEKTVDCLEAAYAERSSYLPVIGIEPGMNFLRRDPRFKSLQRRIGFLPDHG